AIYRISNDINAAAAGYPRRPGWNRRSPGRVVRFPGRAVRCGRVPYRWLRSGSVFRGTHWFRYIGVERYQDTDPKRYLRERMRDRSLPAATHP
ncbi:hypothetical protein, partial [Frankia sp. Cr2]|uniref:hypothetical protein n=1 Tax=Frankia sp. Cr2 TaxID=3073932 RepID=UPI002AD4AC05